MSDLASEDNGQIATTGIKHSDLESLELAMDEEPCSQSSVSMDARSLGDSVVGSLPEPMPGDLSTEINNGTKNADQCEEPLSTLEGVLVHEIDSSDKLMEDHNSGFRPPSDETTLQDHGKEGNLLPCKLLGGHAFENTGSTTAIFRLQDETQIEQSTLSSKTCITELVDGEKVDNELVCFSSSENNRVCGEAELAGDIHNGVSSDLVVDCYSSGIEFETSKASSFAEEASNEKHLGGKKASITMISSNTSSSDVCCNEEKGSHFLESGSPTVVVEPNDLDAKHMAANETAHLVSQGLLSKPAEEIEEGDVGATNSAPFCNGASEALVDNSHGAKDFMEEHSNVEEKPTFVVQSGIMNIADSEKGDDCNVGNENTSDQKCLPRLSEDLPLGDHMSRESILNTVEALKESIGDDAGQDDEDCVVAAANMCQLPSSFMTSQIRTKEYGTLNSGCSEGNRSHGVNVEGNTLSQTEDGVASSEFQHHGFTVVDKDGGSSMDSTAGTGLQLSADGCTPVEDEEAGSTGGEDTASSPARMQPLRQQRKKINVHHQFVREIVKIQHDREQYDREHTERQIQVHQAATLPQVWCKVSDMKKNINSESRDVRAETNKQKGSKDVRAYRQVKDPQQKYSTKNKPFTNQSSRNDSSRHWGSPQEINEQSGQAFSPAMGAKEHGKIGGSNQQRSTSIYRPPVARESHATDHRNLGKPEGFNHQSGTYAMNSSPDGSASSFTESCVPIAGSSHSISAEGPSKLFRSSSGECFADSVETQADSAPGMSIKVTFDTEKKQRHIQCLEGSNSFSRNEQPSPAASHSSSGYKVNKDSKYNPQSSQPFKDHKFSSGSWQQINHGVIPSKGNHHHATQAAGDVNPLLGHPFQDSSFSPGSRQIDYRERSSKGNDRPAMQDARSVNPSLSRPFQDSSFSQGSRHIDHGERSSKGNDRHFTQATRNVKPSYRPPFQGSQSSSVSRQIDHGDTPSKGNDHHFRQAARSDSLRGFTSAEPSHTHGRAGKSSDKPTEKKSSFFERADSSANLHNLSSWLHKSPPISRHGGDGQIIPNKSNTRRSDWYAGAPSPSSQTYSTPRSFQGTASVGPSSEEAFVGSISFTSADVRSEESMRTSISTQGNHWRQQFSTPRSHDSRGNPRYADNGRRKNDSHLKNSTEEFSSPFQAMMKDASRPHAVSMAAQRSADANQDSRGFGSSSQTHSQGTSQEIFRRSQSDAIRKVSKQNSQAQVTSTPSRESLFCTMPMQEKWGDIVDDLTDSYDYLQIKGDGVRETHFESVPYRASNQSHAGFVDAQVSNPAFRDSKQDRGIPKYGDKDINSSQKHGNLVREHSYETPRKSVFERLGPQNNFQESILGPPPKMLDNRGVLKASPDVLMSNVPPVGRFYGSQTWQSQLPSGQHENVDDEGREVVVQAYTEMKQRRSKRELYVPRRGS